MDTCSRRWSERWSGWRRRSTCHRPHVNVVIDLEDVLAGRGGHAVDGPDLDRSSIEALLCDCGLHRVVMKGTEAGPVAA